METDIVSSTDLNNLTTLSRNQETELRKNIKSNMES